MTSVLWVAIVWAPVLYFYVWREKNRELKRLYLALALSLMAAYAIADGDVSSITANPVVAERVLRGLLSGSALLLAAGPLSRALAAVARLRSPNLIALAFYVSVAVLSTLYSVAIPASAGKAFQLGVGFVCTLALATRPNARAVLKRALEMVVLLGGALVIGAVIGFFVLPSVFQFPESRPGILFRQTMGAPYSHPNGLSVYGATLAGFALARALNVHGPSQRRCWRRVDAATWRRSPGAGPATTFPKCGRRRRRLRRQRRPDRVRRRPEPG